MPATKYSQIGADGSTAVGNPNVTVNGGPLAFCFPSRAETGSDIPVVPNGGPLGFGNVMVGSGKGAGVDVDALFSLPTDDEGDWAVDDYLL
jgi:hypothetical protein